MLQLTLKACLDMPLWYLLQVVFWRPRAGFYWQEWEFWFGIACLCLVAFFSLEVQWSSWLWVVWHRWVCYYSVRVWLRDRAVWICEYSLVWCWSILLKYLIAYKCLDCVLGIVFGGHYFFGLIYHFHSGNQDIMLLSWQWVYEVCIFL